MPGKASNFEHVREKEFAMGAKLNEKNIAARTVPTLMKTWALPRLPR